MTEQKQEEPQVQEEPDIDPEIKTRIHDGPVNGWMEKVDQAWVLPPPVQAPKKELKKALKQGKLERPVLMVGWDPATGLGNLYFKSPERGLVVFRSKSRKPLLVVPLVSDYGSDTPYGRMFWFNIKNGRLLKPQDEGEVLAGMEGRFFADAWDDSRIQKIVKQQAPGLLQALEPYLPLMSVATIIILVIILITQFV